MSYAFPGQDNSSDPVGDVDNDKIAKMGQRAKAAASVGCMQTSEAMLNQSCLEFNWQMRIMQGLLWIFWNIHIHRPTCFLGTHALSQILKFPSCGLINPFGLGESVQELALQVL